MEGSQENQACAGHRERARDVYGVAAVLYYREFSNAILVISSYNFGSGQATPCKNKRIRIDEEEDSQEEIKLAE